MHDGMDCHVAYAGIYCHKKQAKHDASGYCFCICLLVHLRRIHTGEQESTRRTVYAYHN